VDLNEEFSAIHGPSIVQQAEYISQVIRFIFEDLYHGKIPVHIVGHSMGGIVAAFLFAQPDFPRHYITSIYTYATPWISSPAPITHQIKDIYDRIFETFQDGTLSNISIISFMAGNRDLTVNSGNAWILMKE
jgi:glycosylphosphatidylinositol deacylase